MSEPLWINERIRSKVLSSWQHVRYERHDAIGQMIEIRDDYEAELARLRVEVERLRGLLPDAVTRDAIHFLAEDALDRKNHFDEPDIVFSWLARLESETPDD